MGYLTTIVIHNDALHSFKEDPKAFAEAIFKGIDEANMTREETPVGFKGYCNYISVHPSRHADDETLYLHSGNSVSEINTYSKEFEKLIARNRDLANELIKRAQNILTWTKRNLSKKPSSK